MWRWSRVLIGLVTRRSVPARREVESQSGSQACENTPAALRLFSQVPSQPAQCYTLWLYIQFQLFIGLQHLANRRGSAAVSTQHLLLFLCFFTILCVTLWFNLFASVKLLENRSIHVSDWIICFQSLHCGSAAPGVQAQIASAMAHNRQYSNLYTSAALCPAGETKERTQ